jgi:hypothetical protein
MKYIVLRSLAGTGLLLFGLTAALQAGPQDRDRYRDPDAWHEGRDTYFRSDAWRMHMFQRVREDLDHVQSLAFTGGDQYRIARTKEELNELQNKLAAREYDQPELDEVIATLQRVVTDNRLTPRDRDILTDDLNRMREYREHHADWR